VFHIEVNHVKSGFFFASKRNEIFASMSNFASEAKVRAHPNPFACVSLVHFKNSGVYFRFFSLQIFRFASTLFFSLGSKKKGKTFFSLEIFLFASKNTFFALFRFTIFVLIHTYIDTPLQEYLYTLNVTIRRRSIGKS
jgi:hypothetical protein